MNAILPILFLFFVGSCVGWVIELFFRKFFSKNNPEHRWINPGFLVGPYLPLYGFGLCALYLLSGVDKYLPIENDVLRKIVLFLVMAAAMTIIEYVAGLIFIKGMKVKLWDYSKMWGNVQGIICPLFSLFWAILGAVYYLFVNPHIVDALNWLAENLAFSFFIGVFYGVFIIDMGYSFSVAAKIRALAKEMDAVVRYEELRQHLARLRDDFKEKRRFFLSMHIPSSMLGAVKKFIDKN